MVKTYNQNIAVTQFPTNTIKTEVRHGVASVKQDLVLQELTVVFACDGLPEVSPGDSVYFRAELMAIKQAKEVHALEGKTFILLPVDQVKIHVKK